jgi:hypothetical protein
MIYHLNNCTYIEIGKRAIVGLLNSATFAEFS